MRLNPRFRHIWKCRQLKHKQTYILLFSCFCRLISLWRIEVLVQSIYRGGLDHHRANPPKHKAAQFVRQTKIHPPTKLQTIQSTYRVGVDTSEQSSPHNTCLLHKTRNIQSSKHMRKLEDNQKDKNSLALRKTLSNSRPLSVVLYKTTLFGLLSTRTSKPASSSSSR